jgi:hypothetical protein
VKTTFIPGRIELDMDAELTLEEAMAEFQSRKTNKRSRKSL